MTDDDLRDRCCWKRCRQESGVVFMGAGVCDPHFKKACDKDGRIYSYLVERVVPAAARIMRHNERQT